MSILLLKENKSEFILTLNDVVYKIYSRRREQGAYGPTYSTTHATLATEKEFLLKRPKIYWNKEYGQIFFMNKMYPHVVMQKAYAKKVKREVFGRMCLGNQTSSKAYKLAESQKFEELSILLEDRLTTASVEDSYINFRNINFQDENLVVCKLCGLYLDKTMLSINSIKGNFVCGGCISKMRFIHGELDLRSIKQCQRCGYYYYKFGRCVSTLCKR
jgi:hypothetical protein